MLEAIKIDRSNQDMSTVDNPILKHFQDVHLPFKHTWKVIERVGPLVEDNYVVVTRNPRISNRSYYPVGAKIVYQNNEDYGRLWTESGVQIDVVRSHYLNDFDDHLRTSAASMKRSKGETEEEVIARFVEVWSKAVVLGPALTYFASHESPVQMDHSESVVVMPDKIGIWYKYSTSAQAQESMVKDYPTYPLAYVRNICRGLMPQDR